MHTLLKAQFKFCRYHNIYIYIYIITGKPFPTKRFKTKQRKRFNRKLYNKTVQIIKTVKTQQSSPNYTNPDDELKYGRKYLGRRYEIIPLPSNPDTKK